MERMSDSFTVHSRDAETVSSPARHAHVYVNAPPCPPGDTPLRSVLYRIRVLNRMKHARTQKLPRGHNFSKHRDFDQKPEWMTCDSAPPLFQEVVACGGVQLAVLRERFGTDGLGHRLLFRSCNEF